MKSGEWDLTPMDSLILLVYWRQQTYLDDSRPTCLKTLRIDSFTELVTFDLGLKVRNRVMRKTSQAKTTTSAKAWGIKLHGRFLRNCGPSGAASVRWGEEEGDKIGEMSDSQIWECITKDVHIILRRKANDKPSPYTKHYPKHLLIPFSFTWL